MSFTVQVVGLKNVLKGLDPVQYRKAVERVVVRGSQILRDETKRLPAVSAKRTGYDAKGIPVDSGRLRQSISARQLSGIAAEVFAPVNYSSFVHEGTSRMPARPFFVWSLELGAGQKIRDMIADEIVISLNG